MSIPSLFTHCIRTRRSRLMVQTISPNYSTLINPSFPQKPQQILAWLPLLNQSHLYHSPSHRTRARPRNSIHDESPMFLFSAKEATLQYPTMSETKEPLRNHSLLHLS